MKEEVRMWRCCDTEGCYEPCKIPSEICWRCALQVANYLANVAKVSWLVNTTIIDRIKSARTNGVWI